MRAELSLPELKTRAAFAQKFAQYTALARKEWEAANATRDPWERQQREEAAIGYERDLKGLVESFNERPQPEEEQTVDATHVLKALAEPFHPSLVKTRPQGGRQLAYITARTVMNRLDDVLGVDGWWDDYQPQDKCVICRLTIRLPDGRTVTKCDAGGFAGMTDEGDDEKSGYSDAFKRAAVKFGVGRHLYGDGLPACVNGAAQHRAPEPTRPAPARPAHPPRDDAPRSIGSILDLSGGEEPNDLALWGSYKGHPNRPKYGSHVLKWLDAVPALTDARKAALRRVLDENGIKKRLVDMDDDELETVLQGIEHVAFAGTEA